MICLFDLTLLFSRFCPFCTIHTRTYKGEQYFMSLYKIIFSPTGGTQKAADAVAQAWKNPAKLIDLTREPECTITFTEEDIVLLAVPSYGGRVPAPAARRLTSLHGSQTPCILVCVYGNRAYEDTLTELQDLAVKQGLHVIAAVTAVAEHSILHQYAAGRPDTEDIRILRNFGGKNMDKEYTCCVTGHRDIPADKIQYVQMQLRQELLQAIQSGYTHFISG